MLVVLLDSSNTSLTVGLGNENGVIESVSYEAWQSQSEHMIPELNQLLDKHHVKHTDITDVVVSIGPGSYTGVRIALTIAKTMALATGANLYGISSLRCQKDRKNPSICVINARSGRSYFGVYEDEKILVEDCVMTNDKVIEYVKEHPQYSLCGSTSYLGLEGIEPDIARELYMLMKCSIPVKDPLGLNPVYMKD